MVKKEQQRLGKLLKRLPSKRRIVVVLLTTPNQEVAMMNVAGPMKGDPTILALRRPPHLLPCKHYKHYKDQLFNKAC